MTTSWSVGDACLVRGQAGEIESIGPECASVKVSEWRRIFCGLDELSPAAAPTAAATIEIEQSAPPPASGTTLPALLEECGSFSNEVAEGEHGQDRLRKKGDPLKKWGIMRRPRLDDIERWYCYRTHVCVSHNSAIEKGAPAEVLAHFAAEHDFAVAHLEKHRPGFTERLHADKAEDAAASAAQKEETKDEKPRTRRVRRVPDRVSVHSGVGRPDGGPAPALGESYAGGDAGVASDYASFVATKLTKQPPTGLATVPPLYPSAFPHQRDLITWALRRGRAAIFADTGLGKTLIQIEWARCVAEHTGKRVLVLAPLAVGSQTVREAERIGVPAKQVRYGGDVEDEARIVVTNYDRLHHFDPSTFGGVVLDESSILKSFDGKTTTRLVEAFGDTPFRLCATATPSPNDYTELGTHAEFLGVCTRLEMLAEYFVHDGGDTSKWRLKGHARAAFWRWLSTWGALLRKPSDLGYDDAGYDLPPLQVMQHTIPADADHVRASGLLFAEPAKTLVERRAAKKSSVSRRVEQCAELARSESKEQWLIWCELNAESEALTAAIPGAVEIRGSDDPLLKESRLLAFASGEVRVLVTKVRIAGFGMNFQRCARMAFVGVNDSFESYYQAIRRSWRFGQQRSVHVHIFASELEGDVVRNLQRKERDATAMAEQLSVETRDAVRGEVRGSERRTNLYAPGAIRVPSWLQGENQEGTAA